MEIFSSFRKQCQLEYSLFVCPASGIFHFLSKILLATVSAATETHTLMQMRNDAHWDLADWSYRFDDKEQNQWFQRMRFISSRCQSGHHLLAWWSYAAIMCVICAIGLCKQHSSFFRATASLGAGSWISNSICESNLVLENFWSKSFEALCIKYSASSPVVDRNS